MPWISAGSVDALPVGEAIQVRHGDKSIAVFRRPEGYHALDNFCPHRGALMHEGSIFEGTLICPWHQWQFDLKTGKGLTIPGSCLEVYPVKIQDGIILVDTKEDS